MSILEYLKLSLVSLRSNRMRSVLTMIGIIVGISSIVTISTLGITIKDTVTNMVYYQSLNTFQVYMAGRPNSNPPLPELADRLQYDWLADLEKDYPGEFKPALNNFMDYVHAQTYTDETVTGALYAVTDGFFQCEKKVITEGRELLSSDSSRQKYTAVVVDVFVQQYFDSSTNPLGKTIELELGDKRHVKFTVVGVYKTNPYEYPGASGLNDKETEIYIPYETAASVFGSIRRAFTHINFVGNKDIDRGTLIRHLTDFFEKKYIGRQYYYGMIYDLQADAAATEKVVSLIIVIVAGIAAFSLVVAGIGVMNIMLVSISERTKEIGLRKSIGATHRNVLIQFALEAVTICLLGGLAGILFGILNCHLIAYAVARFSSSLGEYSTYIAEVATVPNFFTVMIAIGFSCLVGLISGLYPAMKAARMNPIDALRTE